MSNEATGILFFVIIGAILCGVLGLVFAEKKNVPGGVGFLLGFLLGPIGLIIVAVMPANDPPPPAGMKAVTCPRCNASQNIDVRQVRFLCWQCKGGFPVPD